MRREWGTWGTAVTLSLLLHGLVLWHPTPLISATDGRAEHQAGLTRVSFRTLPKPVPLPQQAPPEPRPEPPPEPKPKPRPVAKPNPRPVAPSTPREREPGPPPASAQRPRGDPRLTEAARRSYLGRLVAHIERYKHYPRAARRRRLGGIVQVSFTLLQNGTIAGLQVEQRGAHPVLVQAAEQTVRSALPLPAAPHNVECPIPVRFGMEFALR